MNINELKSIHSWVKSELNSCTNFWLKYGIDHEHGGVYTCLDREGKIFSRDKSVWMQGRCAWTFAFLCTNYGKNDEWLSASKSCLDFLEKYCRNWAADGRLYFTVTGDGKPLRQRRYCFSEGFYAMANAEYYANTGDKLCLERARWAYEMIYKLNNGLIKDPTGMGPKTIPETRSGRAFADAMIYLNITNVLRRCDPDMTELYDARAKECVDNIFKYHFKPELKCTLEVVGPKGELQTDTVAGRVVNPGHDIEGSWFVQQEALYEKDEEMSKQAQAMFRCALEAGWDKQYGGLLYFIDALGMPPEAYEHDMKLWWTHNELLIASAMYYRDTKDEYYWDWFVKTAQYCKDHFADPQYGEWFGYLRRDGNPTEPPCKGSTFKGPFHVQRSLIYVDKILDDIEAEINA